MNEFPPSDLIDAWQAGFRAQRNGLNHADNPHPPGSYAYAEWSKGWITANK